MNKKIYNFELDDLKDNDLNKLNTMCVVEFGNLDILDSDLDHIFIYSIGVNKKNEQNIIDNSVSYLTTKIVNDIVEIYNVCSDPEYRGKGYMSKLLKYIFKYYKSYNFRLGVDLNQPLNRIKKLITYYSNFGFKNPILKVDYIELTRKDNKKKDILDKSLELHKIYMNKCIRFLEKKCYTIN